MKKFIALFLTAVMAITCLTACGGSKDSDSKGSDFATIKKSGKIIVGITEYNPMSYYDTDGTLIGFDTEFTKAVCEKLGIEPSFQIIDWNTKETLLKSKNIDCIWNGLTVTEDRKANMDFSDTYLLNKQVVVINSKDKDKFSTKESLAKALLSAEDGSAGETAIKDDKAFANASYTPSDKQMTALTGLLAGNYDAVVLDYTLALANCGNGDFKDMMIVEDIQLTDEEYAIGFRKGSDMPAEVNKCIKELVDDGTLAKLAEKYELTDLYNELHK